jgi:hypothetical protein
MRTSDRCHILKGDTLGDEPIERPSKFELTESAKTAEALDVATAQALLPRADEVMRSSIRHSLVSRLAYPSHRKEAGRQTRKPWVARAQR